MSADESHPFSIFWAAYPRRKDKVSARDAFRWAMQHHNQDGQLLDTMLSAIAWQRIEQPEPQFWPMAQKWLLTERWTDEPLETVVVPTSHEKRQYDMWRTAVGAHISQGVTLADWVKRQRKGAA